MDLLTQHFGTAQEYAIMVFGVRFVFTGVVFIHELGHFLVARWCGV
ncbi:MAG: RIP metalloprotease RseP, partial [Hyphomicrobiaceae bacterium]